MDPTPQTLASTFAVQPVPRKMPVPEGPPGPAAVDASLVAVPVFREVRAVLDPVAGEIAALIRGGIAGTPDAVRTLAEAAPDPATVFRIASAGLGAASLGVGLTGAAAQLLAGPTAAVPYVGAAAAGWSAVAPPVSAALGAGAAGFQALATGTPFLNQWGQLAPQIPALAIPPPPNAV